jgi:uncharacterized NAD(P)/FAD-binding protein YdhS
LVVKLGLLGAGSTTPRKRRIESVDVQSLATIIVGAFALLALVLAHTRALLRDIARTIQTWHEVCDALRKRSGRANSARPEEGEDATSEHGVRPSGSDRREE